MLLIAAACALLNSAEIQKVQGAPPKDQKESATGVPGLAVERCFYTLPVFAQSISLEVTRGDGVRGFWKKSFHQEHEGGEKEARPQRVRQLGEEAYWVGDPRLGGLYVLRKDAMLRLAVGGNEPQKGKLRKLTQLARAALRRL